MVDNNTGIDLREKPLIYSAADPDSPQELTYRVRKDYLPLVKNILIPNHEILSRERQLIEQIEKDYAGQEPLFIPILKGATRFAIDLFSMAEHIDPEFEFMSASSYGKRLLSGDIQIDLKGMYRLLDKLKDRHRPVILVEDIVDTGQTLSHIVRVLQNIDEVIDSAIDFKDLKRSGSYQPSDVRICTLLNKPEKRIRGNENLPVQYVGFTIPSFWVFGYGLDVWDDKGRTLDHICVLVDEQRDPAKLEEFFRKTLKKD